MRALLRVARDEKWFRYVLGLLVICGFLHATARAEVNVDAQVSVTRSGLVFNRGTGTFDSVLTLTNTSGISIDEPLNILVSNLNSGGVTVANATGRTSDGTPLILVSKALFGLRPGEQASQIVRFFNPSRASFQFTTTTRSGVSSQDQGVLLVGAPTDLALSRSYSVLNFGVPASEIIDDPVIGQLPLTRIALWIKDTATVGDVNALLTSLGADIVGMAKDVPFLEVRIPNPGSVAALDDLIGEMGSHHAVRQAVNALLPTPATLPAGLTNLASIHHQLAVRAAAAWNARSAILSIPRLFMIDAFGRDLLGDEYNADIPKADISFLHDESTHGYRVLSIISAQFDQSSSVDVGDTTGIFPGKVNVRAVNFTRLFGQNKFQTKLTSFAADNLVLELILAQNISPNNIVVLNTSLGFPCKSPKQVAKFCNEKNARFYAEAWRLLVRKKNLEDKVFHATAAGNIAVPGDINAAYASGYTAAALLPATPRGQPPLANIVSVENAVTNVDQVYDPKSLSSSGSIGPFCLSSGSKHPGQVSAIGDFGIWTIAPVATGGYELFRADRGTSLSSAQVAGLAIYLLAIDPSLSVAKIKQIILDTARQLPSPILRGIYTLLCSTNQAKPVIDAYAAVLAADTPDKKVRKAILDVDGNGQFDEMDLAKYFNEFSQSGGAIDYSRYDLNGDGRTGGDTVDRFDLDNVSPVDWKTVTQTMDGQAVTFDESQLTDRQILCYYAYDNSLYQGDVTQRQFSCQPKLTVDMVGLGSPPLNKDWSVSVLGSGSLCLMDAHFDVCPTKRFDQMCGLIGLQWGAVVDLTAYVSAGDQCSSWVPYPPNPLRPWWAPDGTCSYFNCASLPPQFVEWGGDCSGTATTTTVKLTSDKHCTVVIRWP